MNIEIFLPGTDKQSEFLLKNTPVKGFSILILGTESEQIAWNFLQNGAEKVNIIVEDNDSLLTSRLKLKNTKISIRLMEFDNTDFKDSEFDLVYAQASVSNKKRNKITKEVIRILKAGGVYCAGEVTSLTKSPPKFVDDLWKNSGVTPLYFEEAETFYRERKFDVIETSDLSQTLRSFYITTVNLLRDNINNLSEQEKSYYKKMLNIISHESNAYLNLGGSEHMGFHALILKKG